MKKQRKKTVELLAPAGDLTKLKYALRFGADAVYCGVPDLSLRVRINRFSQDDLVKAVKYAHSLKKKIYVTLNIYAKEYHLELAKKHLLFLKKIRPDALIVSDPGIINLIKKYYPKAEIHLSTQANATNSEAVKFWKKAGVKRIILAREVTLSEIKEIKKKVPDAELEYFVHGAMCMSYSGRCILSQWMSGRSANLGDCSQPCRWNYENKYQIANSKKQINSKLKIQTVEKKPNQNECGGLEMSVTENREGLGIDLEEDQHGTYFFNSFDLNLIEYLKDLQSAGVSSFKIEGRAKSALYVAVVTRAYRKVLDAIEKKLSAKTIGKIIVQQKEELKSLVHRGYWTGFLLGDEPPHNFDNRDFGGEKQFVGEVEGHEGSFTILRVHNQIQSGDKLEAITPQRNLSLKIEKIFNDKKEVVLSAHGGHEKRYFFQFNRVLETGDLIRKM